MKSFIENFITYMFDGRQSGIRGRWQLDIYQVREKQTWEEKKRIFSVRFHHVSISLDHRVTTNISNSTLGQLGEEQRRRQKSQETGLEKEELGDWAGEQTEELGDWAGEQTEELGDWAGEQTEELGDWAGEQTEELGDWAGEQTEELGDWAGEQTEELGDWAGEETEELGDHESQQTPPSIATGSLVPLVLSSLVPLVLSSLVPLVLSSLVPLVLSSLVPLVPFVFSHFFVFSFFVVTLVLQFSLGSMDCWVLCSLVFMNSRTSRSEEQKSLFDPGPGRQQSYITTQPGDCGQ
ncbi:unnamed protein product [Boreogadus saida]